MSWSSPFPEESVKRPRQKIVSTKQLEDDDPLANYTPPPKPERINRKVEPDMPNVYETSLQDSYKSNPLLDSYKSNDSELLEKLNYMITLLEEQRDEKTGQVTEELILYVFF